MTTSTPMAHYPRVIGLTGLAGSGKDSIADILRQTRSYVPIAFADPLRNEIIDAFGISYQALTERTTKEEPPPCSRCATAATWTSRPA